ncbi:MAG: hypothetical protein SCK29_14585 [Bacillota bacterium]|nr:hypothetical protein [Bacillota bacterium]MDW7685328.1 hypothetical protein [Bacillota bacterium]
MKLKWGIDQLYFYLVCFVMLITIIVGVTGLVRAGIDMLIPLPDQSTSRPYYEPKPVEPPDAASSQLTKELIEQELQNQKVHQENLEQRNSFNSAMLQLFRSLAQILVAFPVYLYHWRKIPLLDS